MKYTHLVRYIIFSEIVISIFFASCSAPADNWSCEKLRSEIKNSEKEIIYANVAYERGTMTLETYKFIIKTHKDCIAYYKSRLRTCKEITTEKPINIIKRTDIENKKINPTKPNLEEKNSIEGIWIKSPSSGISVVSRLIITKIDPKHFKCTMKLIDGGNYYENLTLNSNNEYQTYNKFGEYFKIVGNELGAYDKDGLIETYYKIN